MSNFFTPILVDQIMRDHMDRAARYRRAAMVRAPRRERPARHPRVRRAFGALVGRPAT